ncbi:MAG: hypothetical protein N2053_00040 [Chitinispirillaceae bacterium]|nr:hypothetical protein [Chitinispirillaceae bacterium]
MRLFYHILRVILNVYLMSIIVYAEPPPDLPGEEITKDIIRKSIRSDSMGSQLPTPVAKDTLSWYDRAAKTWEAPPLWEQVTSDKTNIPMGRGGVFVPRFTEANDEPDVEILTLEGTSVKVGEPGQTFSVEPGIYYVMLGSGSHRQRLVRKVEVFESKITPLLPDWSGLLIETIDTTAMPFKGEYELIRIDEFEAFGRGFGADPELGEKPKVWILKPGVYKILGRGESYNTFRNFITVRLLPGELTKVILIQKPTDMSIISGGTIDVTPVTKISSHWKFGANIGGNIQFTNENDRKEDRNTFNSVLSIRTLLWLRFFKERFEWESNLLLDEGLSLSETNLYDLITAPDDFRIISLFIYRLFSWVGPYARAELRTNIFPNRVGLEEKKEFCVLNSDSTINKFIYAYSFPTKPSLCPLEINLDLGANIDAVNSRFVELKVRSGVGTSFNSFRDRYETRASDFPVNTQDTSLLLRLQDSRILFPLKAGRYLEFGPQGSFKGNIRLGRIGIASGELRIFAPVVPDLRITRPDFDLLLTLSLRLTKGITLDYDYTYLLKQPKDINARENYTTHKIYLRFSYTGR